MASLTSKGTGYHWTSGTTTQGHDIATPLSKVTKGAEQTFK
jgi:hypothetical protein